MSIAATVTQTPTSEFEFGALREANNYRAALIEAFRPYLKGRVMEIGAGIGQMTSALRKVDEIEHLVAVEPNSSFCDRFRTIFRGQDLIEGTVHNVPFDPARVGYFDRVIFPKVHWFETKVATPSFGQSLLAIAKVKWDNLPD